MNHMSTALPFSYRPADSAQILDADLSMATVANALLACHARGADDQTMLTMCERLLSVTERELLERERKMMAAGDPDLAAHVRRHGDVLLVLGRQVRDSRRAAAPLSTTFIRFVGTMLERMRTTSHEAA
jgi:hypothetical protein